MSHCGVAGEEGGGGRRGGCGKGERVQSLGGVLWGKAAFFLGRRVVVVKEEKEAFIACGGGGGGAALERGSAAAAASRDGGGGFGHNGAAAAAKATQHWTVQKLLSFPPSPLLAANKTNVSIFFSPQRAKKKNFFLRAKEFILLGAFFSNPKEKQKKVQFSLTCFSKQRNEERSSFFSLIRPFFPSVLFCPFRLIRPESDRSLCGESTNKLRLCGNFMLYLKFSTGTKVFLQKTMAIDAR